MENALTSKQGARYGVDCNSFGKIYKGLNGNNNGKIKQEKALRDSGVQSGLCKLRCRQKGKRKFDL